MSPENFSSSPSLGLYRQGPSHPYGNEALLPSRKRNSTEPGRSRIPLRYPNAPHDISSSASLSFFTGGAGLPSEWKMPRNPSSCVGFLSFMVQLPPGLY